jgi:hypothetical protein
VKTYKIPVDIMPDGSFVSMPTSEWSPTIGLREDNVKDKSSSGIHLCDTIGQPEAANSDDEPDYKSHIDWSLISNYTTLRAILDAAFSHAATGKGKERHARDLPFDDQPIMQTTRLVGPGFPLGQAIKKAGEAAGMIERGELSTAEAECLGAINYLAGAVAWMREQKNGAQS